MNRTGFQLTQLALKGPNVDDAIIKFGPGLNVISGPSDTGKTFISECIDYAFGASSKPSDVPEAKDYDKIELEIAVLSSGVHYTLQRSLRGGPACLSTLNEPDRLLGEKHQAGNKDTISSFMLSLCGLDGRLVRTNSRGTTRPISFRDVSQLVLVTEEEIIRKESPIHSGERTDATVENSVFRLLLTGLDDTSVIETPKKEIRIAENKGREELLNTLVEQTRSKLESLSPGIAKPELNTQLQRIEASILESSVEIQNKQDAAASLEDKRKAVWISLREHQSKHAVLTELQNRFSLLKSQYISDLNRLECIADAGDKLDQIDQTLCPVCGAEPKYHSKNNADHKVAIISVAIACAHEVEKLQLLMIDLDNTIHQNGDVLHKVAMLIADQKEQLQLIEGDLSTHFKPRLSDAVNRLQEDRSLQAKVREAIELHDQLEVLNGFRRAVESNSKPEFLKSAGSFHTEEFALRVEEVLRAWQFPELRRVTFNDSDQDILVSGRKRADHGKGVRAITHAAFTIGLMYYCNDKRMPHPGFVVIDSPLVVYREPDSGETGFSRTLKDLAYKHLAAQADRGQIIILENEDPPADMPDVATLIHFTGAQHGRKGFIPPARSQK